MRVLLDEHLSRRLRRLITGHTVATVAYQGWRGVRNGALLALAEKEGFEVFLTADQNLSFQQNVTGRKIAIVVLSTNNFSKHRTRIGAIEIALKNCTAGIVTVVDLG